MSSTESDLYKILGVARDATPEQIKKAYYKLATKHHPDKGGDKETFQKIGNAYAVLSDPDNRGKYDRGEEIKPDNSLAKLMTVMTQLVVKVIQSSDVKFTDVLEVMRNELDAAVAQGDEMKKKIVAAVTKINEARSRFGGEAEAMEAILLNTINGMERQQAEVEAEMEMVKAILEKVKKMTYKVDKKTDKTTGYQKVMIDDIFRTMYGGK